MSSPVILSSRQADELATRTLGTLNRRRLTGHFIRSCGGYSTLLGRLEDLGLVNPRGYRGSLKPTEAGLDALEANFDKLPVIDPTLGVTHDDIRSAIARRRQEIAEEQEAAGRAFDEAKAQLRAKRAAKEARIPGKLKALVRYHCPGASVRVDHASDDSLVALWRAIVDADASL